MKAPERNYIIFILIILAIGFGSILEGWAGGGSRGGMFIGLGIFMLASAGFLIYSYIKRTNQSDRL
ncbi:hypothetical protein [Streptomyces sp. NPDC059398]|uniref:hypothetical protein n=1 Tax=Streptomyces sp. NPDC059398 TaxID=3346820 RepID=UPI0036783BDD